jgi:hypothetical protein
MASFFRLNVFRPTRRPGGASVVQSSKHRYARIRADFVDSIRTITFDSYSTLVDVEAVEAALADRVDDPKPVSRHWRSRSLLYTVVTNEIDQYDSFYALNRAALEHALPATGLSFRRPSARRSLQPTTSSPSSTM